MATLLDILLTLTLLVVVLFVVNRVVLWGLGRVTLRPTLKVTNSTVAVVDESGAVIYEEPSTATLSKTDGTWRIAGFGATEAPADSETQVFNVVTEHSDLPSEVGGLLDGLLLYCARRAVLSSSERPLLAVARPIRGKVKLELSDPDDRAWALRQVSRSKYFDAA